MRDLASPPLEVREALDGLEGLRGLQVDGDLGWCRRNRVWVFPFRVEVAVPEGALVPSTTSWWAHLGQNYPGSRPTFLPAKQDGLVTTNFHQEANLEGSDREPWRLGAPCLHRSIAAVLQLGDVSEPRTPRTQLRWYVQRLQRWLTAAARGELLAPGDVVELPDARFGKGPPLALTDLALDWTRWSSVTATTGYARMLVLGEGKTRIWLVGDFEDADGRTVTDSPDWGPFVRSNARAGPLGLWVRTSEVPVLPPWQVPSTWHELVSVFSVQGLDIVELLWPLVERRLRGSGKEPGYRPRHPLLVGFPMAERVGWSAMHMHWLGFELPVLAERQETHDGFRPGRRGRRLLDLRQLRGLRPLPWMRSQSWLDRDLTGRGRLEPHLWELRVIVIGVGALGSAVAELLVRGGVRTLAVFDGDRLDAGNLVRHILTLNDLERNKATAVAERLNQVSPHVRVLASEEPFAAQPDAFEAESRSALADADLVIDCTAEDSVLVSLERFDWERERTFASFSLGLHARRLYCFFACGASFPRRAYVEAVTPWLEQDLQGLDEAELPREGVGCWHPLMPATIVDVWLFAATAVRSLEADLARGARSGFSALTVYEQSDAPDAFTGVRRLTAPGK